MGTSTHFIGHQYFFIDGCENLKTIKVPKGKGEYYKELIKEYNCNLVSLIVEED